MRCTGIHSPSRLERALAVRQTAVIRDVSLRVPASDEQALTASWHHAGSQWYRLLLGPNRMYRCPQFASRRSGPLRNLVRTRRVARTGPAGIALAPSHSPPLPSHHTTARAHFLAVAGSLGSTRDAPKAGAVQGAEQARGWSSRRSAAFTIATCENRPDSQGDGSSMTTARRARTAATS